MGTLLPPRSPPSTPRSTAGPAATPRSASARRRTWTRSTACGAGGSRGYWPTPAARAFPAALTPGGDFHWLTRGFRWLAGGLGVGSVGAAIEAYGPELVDASSRLEAEKGRKDRGLLAAYFKEIEDHAH